MRRARPPTRRLVLAAAGASLLRAAQAQPVERRIATLGSGAGGGPLWAVFWQELRALGYSDQEIAIESRWAAGHEEYLPRLAAELVQLGPEVIVAGNIKAALAAKQATSTIPIVVVAFSDPVGAGLVTSFAHPGGNVTGLSIMQEDTVGKRLELLKTAAPGAERVAVLVSARNPAHPGVLRAMQEAARTLRTELVVIEVHAPDEIDGALDTAHEHADAILVIGDALFLPEANRIVALAASYRLPAIYGEREFVTAGGLMSYGPDLKDNNRRAAAYVDRILKGAKPADLPIEQPTKFELVVNLRTARALGLELPPSIIVRADEVIE